MKINDIFNKKYKYKNKKFLSKILYNFYILSF